MKSKLRNLLLAAMALTLFAGCSNIALNDAAVEGSDAGDKCVLTISYSDLEGLLTETSEERSARTIDPGEYTKSNATKFRISGKTNRNTTFTKELNFSSSSTDTVTLSYDEWSLTLIAYELESDDTTEKVILQGNTTVDLRKSVPASLTFKLSTKGVTTEGGLNLTVKGITNVVKSYKAGLYDINTDECKYLLGDADVVAADISSGKTFTQTIDDTPVTKFVPGSYIFKFIPYNDVKPVANATDSREDLTPYSDVITIAPGRTTTAEVTISVMSKPQKPTGFSASLVKSSEKDKDNYYTVFLNWADNSSNEESFVLRIYESNGTEEDDPDLNAEGARTALQKMTLLKEFDSLTFQQPGDENIFGDDVNKYWVSGTLGMSTTKCQINLPTGHLYEMTLAAKNRAGESEVCSRVTPIIADSDADKFLAFTADKRVNRQKITYNLLEGVYKENATATPVTKFIFDYRTYDTAYSLLSIASPATLVKKVGNKEYSFVKWVEKANSSSAASLGANDYKDKIVYASYDADLTVGYEIVNEYMTLQITPSVTDVAGATYTETGTKLVLDTTATNFSYNNEIIFTIANKAIHKTGEVDADGNPETEEVTIDTSKCEKIAVWVDGSKIGEKAEPGVDSYECNLNTFCNEKIYNIVVVATFDGKDYSCNPIKLDVHIIVE